MDETCIRCLELIGDPEMRQRLGVSRCWGDDGCRPGEPDCFARGFASCHRDRESRDHVCCCESCGCLDCGAPTEGQLRYCTDCCDRQDRWAAASHQATIAESEDLDEPPCKCPDSGGCRC